MIRMSMFQFILVKINTCLRVRLYAYDVTACILAREPFGVLQFWNIKRLHFVCAS